MTIDKIIESNTKKFELWEKQLSEHFEAQYHPGNLSKEENERIFFQSNELLMSIADNFFTYGKFKDKWDTSKCHLYYSGQNLLLKSEKMNITFDCGLQENEFYIQSYIMYAENIRYMTDDFWTMLLELKSLGELEYSGSGSLSAKERPYFENKTSAVFQIIRNFILNQVGMVNGTDYQQPSSMDIGHLTLKWNTDTAWADLLENTCKAFKLLYSMNYQLWKIDDLAKKKMKKNNSV
ncbi:MAG: hypothetical protein JWR12_3084 [Mucilaginibacter sp.]|nr:hypothetical protein [Mucilaginibacter sp.]